MSNEYPNPVPASVPAGKKSKKRRDPNKPKSHLLRKTLVLTGVGVLGIIIGSAAAGGTPDPEVVVEEKVVEKEVPVEKVVEKEVEVEVEKTPASCIDALDAAVGMNALNVMVHDYNASSFDAASRLDSYTIESNSKKISDLAPKMGKLADDFREASEECRAS